MEDTDRQKEDYREFWKQVFLTTLNGALSSHEMGKQSVYDFIRSRDDGDIFSPKNIIKYATMMADMALAAYKLKRDSLRKENLQAFT